MNEIQLKSFDQWDFRNEIDLMICDIPFSLKFDGKQSNYNREKNLVVDGYVEWNSENVESNIKNLLESANKYLSLKGSLLIFSGWQISLIISKMFLKWQNQIGLKLKGKLYWNYNFAPYCKKKPAHNVYEIFWFTKSKNWFYNNNCSLDHCRPPREANLTTITVKREYLKGISKYPTKLPSELIKVILEHFTNKDSVILDPLCGSGIVGIVNTLSYQRKCFLGDLNSNCQKVHDEILDYFQTKKGKKKYEQ